MIAESLFPHLFFVLIAVSRGLDLLSTWLVTPKMSLEANPVMKKLKWHSIVLINLLLLLLPYVHLGLSLTMIVLSFLVAGNTLGNAALSWGLGEKNHLRSIKKAIRGGSISKSLALNTLGAFSVITAGILLMITTNNPWDDLVWWGALGVVSYGLTALIQVNFSMIKLFQKPNKQKHRALSQNIGGTAIRPRSTEGFGTPDRSHEIKLKLSTDQYEQIHAKAQLFGKTVEDFCFMIIIESKARIK